MAERRRGARPIRRRRKKFRRSSAPSGRAPPLRSGRGNSCQLQSAHRAGGRGELVGFDAHALEHRNVEVGQRVIVGLAECVMLAMPETAARKNRGHIETRVGVGVAEVGTVKHHRAIEERVFGFAHGFQVGEQFGEELHVPLVDGGELGAFLLGFSVVREVVVTVGDGLIGNVEGGRTDAVEHERDGAGRIRLEGEAREIVHDFNLLHVRGGIGGIDRDGCLDNGFWFRFPTARGLEAVLEIAHAREILVEAVAVAGGDPAGEFAGLAGNRIEDAATVIELAQLRLHLLGRALEKKLFEHLGGLVFGRDGDAGAGPRKAARAGVDGERERGKTREGTDLLGDVLVERDGVAKRTATRMRRGRKETYIGGVPAIDVGVRDPAKNTEIGAMVLKIF